MHTAMRCTIRSIAAVLSFAILSNPIAYANTQASISAQATAPEPLNAPLPTQIATAHTVFLSNTGADASFPVNDTQAYNQVYAALQAWGHYRFVTVPAQADLIFQLHEAAPSTDYTGYHDRTYTIVNPVFQLNIIDPKTNTTLWVITSPAQVAGRAKARARWFSIAVTNLISRIKVVAGQPLSATETADLTTVPQHHGLRTGLIIGGSALALGVAGGLILHHEFENSLASQKQSQDNFCEANNIPLSECAGG